MRLQTDEQTINDLRIFSKSDVPGIYDLYNDTHTRGGEAALREMFLNPMSDRELLNHRSGMIEQFSKANVTFPYKAILFDMAEKYLMHTNDTGRNASNTSIFGEKEILNGVTSVIDLIKISLKFLQSGEVTAIKSYTEERMEILALLTDPVFEPVVRENSGGKLPYATVTAFDTLFRVREHQKIKKLLSYIFRLDVYLSVAAVANKRKFVFPKALEKGQYELKLEGLYHPELQHPKSNDMVLNSVQPIVFLTGANMAGKSTLLRAVSTAVYIAHMGFPVAAKSMSFPVLDGIYTTINLPDNLGIGASHFYAEVLRVKKVAQELHQGKSLFIIFDELFRGTNVKDAHEGTVEITNAFSKKSNSMFIISSHIVEAGEQLVQNPHVRFQYLPTRMKGHTPEYTYTLEEGITEDRHGMIIIKNEGILETLKNGRKRCSVVV
ncbi:MutS-related protein [Pedobacter nyackensis]|uniref:MutS-related protein n=1 Tax=Pedobacter nyackensis TaxID=475255 RepID=UPI00292D32AD|nr:DNA mismatch repair protein [Pedobacter nyackensis]